MNGGFLREFARGFH